MDFTDGEEIRPSTNKIHVLLGCCARSKSRVEQSTVKRKIYTETQKMLTEEITLQVTLYEKGIQQRSGDERER